MKLHLGCGKRKIPEFFHMDGQSFPHLDRQGDIRNLSFLSDESVSLIYCCHAFEYFDREESEAALSEWQRVLRVGGILRLAVPDFAALSELYQQSKDLSRLLGPLYGRIGTDEARLYHRTVYDFESLRTQLEKAGFKAVRRYDWRETEHSAVDDFSQAYFPHMEKISGKLLSLNVEATKQ